MPGPPRASARRLSVLDVAQLCTVGLLAVVHTLVAITEEPTVFALAAIFVVCAVVVLQRGPAAQGGALVGLTLGVLFAPGLLKVAAGVVLIGTVLRLLEGARRRASPGAAPHQ